MAQLVICLLCILAAGLHHRDLAHPGNTVYLERAECFLHQAWLVMEGTVGQVGLGLGTCGSADLYVQVVFHPSHDLLLGAHHTHGATVEGVVACLVVLAQGEVERLLHALLALVRIQQAAHQARPVGARADRGAHGLLRQKL